MSTAKHTPTPWMVSLPFDGRHRYVPVMAKRRSVLVASVQNHHVSREVAEANAAFIVRAVNAHEELLGASKELIDFLKKPMDLRAEKDLEEILLRLNQAIANAEGLAEGK